MRAFEGKLILTDLDGTLLNEKDCITEESRRAIDAFIQGGGLFSVATGRSKRGMEHFFPQLRINAPAILSNGTVIYDFETRRDVYTACIGEKGLRLVQGLMKAFPELGIEVYAEHDPYVAQESEYTRAHFRSVKLPWNPCPPERIPQPWLNLVITGAPERLSRAAAWIGQREEGFFFTQFSGSHMLEVMRWDANKGAAALRLAKLLHIPPEGLYTVGDGPNDAQLVACSPHGCAPENACEEIRTAARHILPDNSRDPIAELIRRIGKGMIA